VRPQLNGGTLGGRDNVPFLAQSAAVLNMPTVSRFFGITVRMYFDDHEPAHFHAYYAESEAKVTIDGLDLIEGSLPRRALALVLEWASQHRDELRENWRRSQGHEPLHQIEPLE
jgi:hypothetical protein